MQQVGGNAVTIVGAFKDLFIVGKECSGSSSAFMKTPIPKFEEQILTQLCQDSIAFLRRSPTLVEIDGPVYIVGDLYGNLMDLVRIISKCGACSTTKYVFLGNYVGRGFFSVPCLALLLAMYCLCPNNIVLLRGVNEFEETSSAFSFEDEIVHDYGPENGVHAAFQEVFANLPYACLIGGKILCVHGGITKRITSMSQITGLERPIYTWTDQIVSDLVSAKTNPGPNEYINSETNYERSPAREFIEKNKLRKIVRSHEWLEKGVTASASGKVLTVFSCSNFEERKNKAGVIYVNEDLESRGIAIGKVRAPRRDNAEWLIIQAPKKERHQTNARVFRQVALAKGVGVKRRQLGGTAEIFQDQVSQARRSSMLIINREANFKPKGGTVARGSSMFQVTDPKKDPFVLD